MEFAIKACVASLKADKSGLRISFSAHQDCRVLILGDKYFVFSKEKTGSSPDVRIEKPDAEYEVKGKMSVIAMMISANRGLATFQVDFSISPPKIVAIEFPA